MARIKYNENTYPYPLPFDNSVGKDTFREIPKAPDIQDVDDEFKQANCYKNNTMLRGANIQFPYTPEQIEEIKKCRDDVLYFIENYVRILTLDNGMQLFEPFQYQRNMIKMMEENRFSIFTTSRQAGKCVSPDTLITVKNKSSGVVEDITIGELFERAKSQ